jgi:hypothetical protein
VTRYRVEVTYTVDVDDEVALRAAAFGRVGTIADDVLGGDRDVAGIALTVLAGRQPLPAVPGGRVVAKQVTFDRR